jgi:hypothetical protein
LRFSRSSTEDEEDHQEEENQQDARFEKDVHHSIVHKHARCPTAAF